jgi:beta-1,4-mannosyl-glycoprotein beta-1,4-N-acetylglucosaminyltransferase
MKIIDTFIFYNEIELLTYRLSILNEYVDYFVLVEARYSFSGKPKELYYENNKDLFKEFNKKIIHIILDDLPYKFPNINYNNREQWANEYFNRDQISLGINKINLEHEDIIITSDLDEIVNPNILIQLRNNTLNYDKNGLNRLGCDMYYYNLNTLLGRNCWHGIKLLNFKISKILILVMLSNFLKKLYVAFINAQLRW